MKIFGWAADNAGPGFYRLRVPFEEMARHTDHTLEIDTTMPDWVLDEADVVVGQRVCQPGATERWRRLATGAYGRRPMLVFEIDDDLWDIDPANRPARSFFNLGHPELLTNLTECAKLADVCTVSTEPLAEVVRRVNPNVVVLPNQLPALAFTPKPLVPVGGSYRIGWAGGPSHAADVEEMVGGLRQHFRRNPTDVYVNMGTKFTAVDRAVAGRRLHELPWTQDMGEHYRRLAELDIGLAPLRPSLFNRSKSEIKFLEYAANGAAVVASQHGPYERTIVNGETGLLVQSPHEWSRALRDLTSDPALRINVAVSGLVYARTRSIKHHWQSWEKVYAEG
jgi:hypothetical protein